MKIQVISLRKGPLMIKLLGLSLFYFNSIFASTLVTNSDGDFLLEESKFKVADIVKEYAKLKNLNLIMDQVPKGELQLLGPKKIKKADIDLYLSAVLEKTGYTLIENRPLNQIQIIRTRDVRYSGSTYYEKINDVPDNYNHAIFSINLEHANSRILTKNMRPFLSRFGRIIDGRTSDTLTLAGTGKNIHRIHKLIRDIDTPDFPKRVAYLKELNESGNTVTEKEISVLDFIKNQHILFIVAFSLIAGIMGFGIRGFVMKKVEAGW